MESQKKPFRSRQAYVLLHNIRSLHNVGSIFRTADAAGISKIYLSGYTPTPIDRFNRPVKELAKVALGGEHSVEWEYLKNPTPLLKSFRTENITIIGIEQDAKAVDYKKVKVPKKVLFVVGSEVEGMSEELRELCDILVEIPMLGSKESLNVGVSLGIALFRMLNI